MKGILDIYILNAKLIDFLFWCIILIKLDLAKLLGKLLI